MTYRPDFLNNGTPSADDYTAGDEPSKGCDDNESTYWLTAVGTGQGTPYPHFWKYDLGAGITKIVKQLRIKTVNIDGANTAAMKDFTLQGSNNDSDYTVIHTGQQANNTNWQEYTITNVTPYRYYRLNGTTAWCEPGYRYMGFYEVEMKEAAYGGSFLNNFT